jgi:hypothetical protein
MLDVDDENQLESRKTKNSYMEAVFLLQLMQAD